MTEQMPGELIYEYTIQSTGATSYGVPPLDALLSGVADIPTQGARYDLAFQGPIVGQRLRGTLELVRRVVDSFTLRGWLVVRRVIWCFPRMSWRH
jgi:hypothetical protein